MTSGSNGAEGAIELLQEGNLVILNSTLSDEQRSLIRRDRIDGLYDSKLNIDKTIVFIRKALGELDALDLLNYAALMAMFGRARIGDSEFDSEMDFLQEMYPERATEYIQSLFVVSDAVIHANNEQLGADDVEFEAKANRILVAIENLIDDINQFLVSWAISFREKSKDDDLARFILESQTLYMVRGNRYRSHQIEFYAQLLDGHSEELDEVFGITGKEVLEGIVSIENAILCGRAEALKKLAILAEGTDFFSEGFEYVGDRVKYEIEECLNKAFLFDCYDVAELTSWPDSLIQALSYGIGSGDWPQPYGEYRYWPITYLPVKRRPFIRVDGRSYCFDYYSLMDNFYRSLYWALCGEDGSIKQKWQEKQKNASEKAVADLFLEMLPGCRVYQGNYYPNVRGRRKSGYSENDMIVIYKNVLLIIEVKAGSFVYTPPIVDYQSHIKSYKTLIEQADHQCERTVRYIHECDRLNNHIVELFDSQGKARAIIDLKQIAQMFELSVTVDNINSFAARADRIHFLELGCGAISIAIDDLMVYRDYFVEPGEFIEYLEIRKKATQNERLALIDELDHLGLYAYYKNYNEYIKTIPEANSLFLTGYRGAIDRFYGRLGMNRAEKGQLKETVLQSVVDAYIADHGKPGRNEPCPCNSGKKYKHCHGR